MKIGILTMTFNNNYGGMLQAFALMQYLKNNGHDVILINTKKGKLGYKAKIKSFLKRFFYKIILRNKNIKYLSIKKEINEIEQNTSSFAQKYIEPRTKVFYPDSDFSKLSKYNFNAVIVGSDQVWRPSMYTFFDKSFLGFITDLNIKKISYAASFGIDTWIYSQKETQKAREELKSFAGVSVREDSGVQLCEKHLGVKAVNVVDPTLLLEKTVYNEIIDKEEYLYNETTLVVYILDETDEKKKIIDLISKEKGIKPTYLNVKTKDFNAPISHRVYPKIARWLSGFKNADFVITDSFHGCVFSILYNKPFVVVANQKRGIARFTSLLKHFDLQNRLVYSQVEITSELINETINWNSINKTLSASRHKAADFLKTSLEHD